jgi:hypothetical protein
MYAISEPFSASVNHSLRPDVERVVIDNALAALNGSDADEWDHYEDAKRAIDEACGWSAPADKTDPHQYRLAVQSYIRLVGL